MNNKLYRIVFNKARGVMMAVAECASSCVKSGSGQTAPNDAPHVHTSAWKRCTPIAFAVLLMGGAQMSTHAQSAFPNKPLPSANSVIVADPSAAANQRPIVLLDSQGRPLVNIQTPSAAGVSRNTYSQFDVQTLPDGRSNVKLLGNDGKPVPLTQSKLDLVQRITNNLNKGILP
jgi:filamentous hemagglutinin